MLNFGKLTFGAEYEFGDVDRSGVLPQGLSWNTKDYSIVSSTGIANDPKGVLYSKGAEINSAPTKSIHEQLEFFEGLLAANLGPKLNYRTNLHLHVRVPGLAQDVDALKRLLTYINRNQAAIYNAIEPIPVPFPQDYESVEAFRGAQKRYKRRKVSHQYKVPEARVQEALSATTPKEFFDAHSKLQANGKRAYGLTTRAGINLLQLQETDTVEFRHFTNTLDVRKLASCFVWVAKFIPAALDGASVEELLGEYDYNFPEFVPYVHDMEIGYQYTNFDKNSRKVVAERLEAMRKDLNLEQCCAEEVASWVKQNG